MRTRCCDTFKLASSPALRRSGGARLLLTAFSSVRVLRASCTSALCERSYAGSSSWRHDWPVRTLMLFKRNCGLITGGPEQQARLGGAEAEADGKGDGSAYARESVHEQYGHVLLQLHADELHVNVQAMSHMLEVHGTGMEAGISTLPSCRVIFFNV